MERFWHQVINPLLFYEPLPLNQMLVVVIEEYSVMFLISSWWYKLTCRSVVHFFSQPFQSLSLYTGSINHSTFCVHTIDVSISFAFQSIFRQISLFLSSLLSYSILSPRVSCPFIHWTERLSLTPTRLREPSDGHAAVAIQRSPLDLCIATTSAPFVRYTPRWLSLRFQSVNHPPLPRIKENYIIVRVFAVYVFGNVEETRQLEIYARPLLLPFCLVDIRRVTRWKKEKKMMIGYQFPRSYSNKVVISRFNQQSYDDCKLWLQRCISLRVAV